jgi:hypothetical protein
MYSPTMWPLSIWLYSHDTFSITFIDFSYVQLFFSTPRESYFCMLNSYSVTLL